MNAWTDEEIGYIVNSYFDRWQASHTTLTGQIRACFRVNYFSP